MKKSLFMAAAMVATMAVSVVFSSCSKDDDVVTPDIVGVWEHYDTSGHYDQSKGEFFKTVITFNVDNTGIMQTEESYMEISNYLSTWHETYEFIYKLDGDLLSVTNIKIGGKPVNEKPGISKCRVEGNKLFNIYGVYPDGSENVKVFTRK